MVINVLSAYDPTKSITGKKPSNLLWAKGWNSACQIIVAGVLNAEAKALL